MNIIKKNIHKSKMNGWFYALFSVYGVTETKVMDLYFFQISE